MRNDALSVKAKRSPVGSQLVLLILVQKLQEQTTNFFIEAIRTNFAILNQLPLYIISQFNGSPLWYH